MSKIKGYNKIPLELSKTLIRKNDNKSWTGNIKFIEYENGRGKQLHDIPKEGFSIIVDPQKRMFFTWMTTEIVEIISNTEFKTKNSHYIII